MKKIIALILAAAFALSLCSCSLVKAPAEPGSSDADSSSFDSSESEVSSQSEVSQENSKREELMKFQFEINGKAITVPCLYSDLTALGYSVEEDEDLEPNTYTIGTYVKNADGESLHVQFWNPSTETKKYSECQIAQIEISLDKKLDVSLPGGLKFDENLTGEQILEAYGEPDYENDSDDTWSIHYEDKAYASVKFMLYKEDKMKGYSSLTINHIED